MGSVLSDRSHRGRDSLTLLAYGLAVANLLLWFKVVRRLLLNSGLFAVVGYDYGMYLTQARSLWSSGPASMYRIDFLNHYHQFLADYTANPRAPLPTAPVPYPPIFAWLLTPLTFLTPPVSFVVWTALSFAALVYLNGKVGHDIESPRPPFRFLALLQFPGIMASLILGQVMIFLACAMAECYLCLRSGRDLRAGIWLAAFALKPHYAVILAAVLLWKRRWWTVLGAAAGTGVVLTGSLIVTGPRTLSEYASSVLLDTASFRGGMNIDPRDMINWRSFILILRPSIGDRAGNALVIVLAAMTIVVLMYICRGSWLPSATHFSYQFTAILVATLLVNYHSPVYGLVLLVVPVASLLSTWTKGTRSWTAWIVVFGLVTLAQPLGFIFPSLKYVPTFMLTLSLLVVLLYLGRDFTWPSRDVSFDDSPALKTSASD